MVFEKRSTDVKTRCGEMLADVEKKHSDWEREVETKSLLGTSSPLLSALLGPLYFLPAPSVLAYHYASEDSFLGSFSSTFQGQPTYLPTPSLTLGLHSEVDMLKPCREVTLEVSQSHTVQQMPLSDLQSKLKVSVINVHNESTTKRKEMSFSTVLSEESEVDDPPRLLVLLSFYPEQAGLYAVSVLWDGHHIKASPLLLPILSEDSKSSALKNAGLLRSKNVLKENVKDENSSNQSPVLSEVQPLCSDAKIEGLKALMDKELHLANKGNLDSPSAVVGENGRTQKMVVEYEMLRRLEKLTIEGKALVKERENTIDVKNQENAKVIFKVEPNEVKKEVAGIQGDGVVQHLPLGGQVVVKKVTAMRRPDQVLYQPPFSRPNNDGVGRGRAMTLHERKTQQVEKLGGVLKAADVAGCKNLSKPAGRGKRIERVKKRRPEGEGVREEQGPRVESIKYQDVQQGVKREKMLKKSPVKEGVEDHQRNSPSQQQLVLHQSSGDGKWNKGNAELEKWKRAQAERDEREEYWMRLEQQRGAANNRKRVERGSAEEARQAGARRTQGKAFNPAHQFDQQNVQRRARRIEDLKVHLAVVADLERSLAANGSIDAKSLEDIGRRKEYEMELKSLEDMKL